MWDIFNKNAIKPLKIKRWFSARGIYHDGPEVTRLTIKTKDKDYSISGFFNMLRTWFLGLVGGYGSSLAFPQWTVESAKKSDIEDITELDAATKKDYLNPNIMRTICNRTISKHNGLCKMDKRLYDLRCKSKTGDIGGYDEFVVTLFKTKDTQVPQEYIRETFEDAVPAKYRTK